MRELDLDLRKFATAVRFHFGLSTGGKNKHISVVTLVETTNPLATALDCVSLTQQVSLNSDAVNVPQLPKYNECPHLYSSSESAEVIRK